jgi:hypothetical protein
MPSEQPCATNSPLSPPATVGYSVHAYTSKDQAATAHVAATSATERDVGGRGGRLAAVGGGGDGRGAAADCAEDWASEGQVVVEEEGAPCGVATRRRRGAPAMRGGLLLLGLGREAPRAVGCAAEASDLTHITDFCRTP